MSASVKYVEWRCSHCGNTVSRAKNLGKPAGGFCSKNNQKPHTYKKATGVLIDESESQSK